MDEFVEKIRNFANNYLSDKERYQKAAKTVPSYRLLTEELPEALKTSYGFSDQFKVEGSVGKGMMTEIPWICIFDRDITSTAQDGYYIAILFTADMSAVWLSLAAGWTQFERAYGQKNGRTEVQRVAKQAQRILRTIPPEANLSTLSLGASKALGRGYEQGTIANYSIKLNEPNFGKELFQKLASLMHPYQELKQLIGANILNIESALDEDQFQDAAQIAEPLILPQGPVELSDKKTTAASYRWQRKPAVSKEALVRASFQCEVDKSHITFLSSSSGLPYLEAHHLIPLEYQTHFTYSLDVPENIVSLCPLCHRKVHHGTSDLVENIVRQLFSGREKPLASRGLKLSFTELIDFYT